MGCREFPAHFALGEDGDTPITESRDLGWMLHDIDFDGECAEPRFFRASMEQGCVTVPELDAAECGIMILQELVKYYERMAPGCPG